MKHDNKDKKHTLKLVEIDDEWFWVCKMKDCDYKPTKPKFEYVPKGFDEFI